MIYLFNLAGYYFLFDYFIQRSDRQLVLRVDHNQYNKTDLVELKIPLSLPYLTNWGRYERVNGQVELNGISYNYVERKVDNDTLYLLCLRNSSKTLLKKARSMYGVMASNIPGEKQANTARHNQMSNDYFRQVLVYNFTAIKDYVKPHTGGYAFRLVHPFVENPDKPPCA